MRIVLTVIFVLVSIALSVIVLAQQGADAGLGAIVSDRLFSYSFVDGKIESDMIKYIYSG